MQPGATINPDSEQPTVQPSQEDHKETSQPVEQPAPSGQWSFSDNDTDSGSDTTGAATTLPEVQPVSWTASEYVAHHKGASWFLLAALGIVVLAAFSYLVTKELVSPIVIGFVGLAFVISGARPPQVLDYTVDNVGIHIGNKSYPYTMFRSFSLLEDGAIHSILLTPAQRVGLPITLYFDPQDEQRIIDVMGSYMPHEVRQMATLDRFMGKIRF